MIDDVTIVGAGPAGLAVARELGRLGVRPVVLERGRVGESWARQYAGLRLHTRSDAASLPGLPWRSTETAFPRADEMVAYLRAYARHFALDVREGVEVAEASPEGTAGAPLWRLRTRTGVRRTRRLVMATGIWSAPAAPALPGRDLFGGRLLHVSSYAGPDDVRGARVLVVGLGNSGKDVAMAAAEVARSTSIATRGGVVFVPYPTRLTQGSGRFWRRLPARVADALLRRVRRDPGIDGLHLPAGSLRDAFPVVGLELLGAVRDGRIRMRPEVVALGESGARFRDGTEGVFDVIVLATGYGPALDAVAPHLRLDAAGGPETSGFAAAGPPGLYLVGYRYPSLETWLQQLRREAPAAARAIAGDLRASGDPVVDGDVA